MKRRQLLKIKSKVLSCQCSNHQATTIYQATTTKLQPPLALTIFYTYCTGGTECFNHTPSLPPPSLPPHLHCMCYLYCWKHWYLLGFLSWQMYGYCASHAVTQNGYLRWDSVWTWAILKKNSVAILYKEKSTRNIITSSCNCWGSLVPFS